MAWLRQMPFKATGIFRLDQKAIPNYFLSVRVAAETGEVTLPSGSESPISNWPDPCSSGVPRHTGHCKPPLRSHKGLNFISLVLHIPVKKTKKENKPLSQYHQNLLNISKKIKKQRRKQRKGKMEGGQEYHPQIEKVLF
jgi:hypothetical protein